MSETNPQDHRKSVREWLSMDIQWKIPVYQRHYAWDAREDFGAPQMFFETVKSQAISRLEKQRSTPHYFGAILVNEKEPTDTHINYDVVDGQQRLTTLSVALFALIGAAKKFGDADELKQELENYLFLPSSPSESRADRTKVRPTNFDHDKFLKLLNYAYRDSVQDQWENRDNFDKSKVVFATNFLFEKSIDFIKTECVAKDRPCHEGINALRDAILDGFEFVLIELTNEDKAQKVFETMNTTGKPLTTFDIIRNSVFERADEEETGLDEDLFHSEQWQVLEDPFWERYPGARDDGTTHIEMYIARMLMAKEGKYINLNRNSIVKAYKEKYAKENDMTANVKTEIAEISTYVPTYKYLVDCPGSRNPVADGFEFGWFMHSQCKNLDMASAIFVIIASKQNPKEKQRMIHLLESYVMRRAVCGLPDGTYNNNQSPSICKVLDNNPDYDKLRDYLHSLNGTTAVFPKNSNVKEGCVSHPIFTSKKKYLRYIFDALALKLADPDDEVTGIGKLTVGHIIPQGWKDTPWQKYLDERRFTEDVVDSRLHTIGNLTPMSGKRNASKSNNPWAGENSDGARDHLLDCKLTMTKKIGEENTDWDIDNVTARSEEIAKTICEIWPDDIRS